MSDIIKEALVDAQGIIRCDREKAHDAEKPIYDELDGQCQAALITYEKLKARVAELEGGVRALLQCPALDDDFNDPDWGDGETALAVSRARATLNHKEEN